MKFVQTHSDWHNTHLSYKLNHPPVFTSHAFQMYLLGTLKQCMLGRIIMLTCSQAILAVPSKYTPSPVLPWIHRSTFNHGSRMHHSFLECLYLWPAEPPTMMSMSHISGIQYGGCWPSGCWALQMLPTWAQNSTFQQMCGFCRGQHHSRVWSIWNTLVPTTIYFTEIIGTVFGTFPIHCGWRSVGGPQGGHLAVLSTLASPPLVFTFTNLQGSHKNLAWANQTASDSLVLNWAQKWEQLTLMDQMSAWRGRQERWPPELGVCWRTHTTQNED